MTLVLEKVRYRYAGCAAQALDGIDLAIEDGQVVGVVGPNESGKSTLCLVAAGLAPGSIGGRLEGSVTVRGSRATASPAPGLAGRCGIVFQDAETQLSGAAGNVWEELATGPRNLALPIGEIVERVEAALDILGIGSLADRDPARLSGGEAQLVALASILALRPAFLILDEPTSQLDPRGTRIVGEAIARLARDRATGILIVEHKTALLARLADEVAVMAAGRIVRRGPAAAILGDPSLADLGVEPAPGARIRGALAAAGVACPTDLEALLAGGSA